MFKNYIKIAWRNLWKNKSFSILNIVGMSIGITVAALIMLWVAFEMGFDRYHENIGRIYEVNNNYMVDGEIWTWNSTPKIMAPTMEEEFPEIEAAVRVNWNSELLFSYNDKRLKAEGNFVDPKFLKVFSFPLLIGSVDNVLTDVNSVVLTETLAKKIFGDNDPIGKLVKIDNSESFKVTGILKDLPPNTDFSFEFLIPWSYLHQMGWDDSNWGNNSTTTYVLLKEGTDYASVSSKVKHLRKKYDKESPTMETLLYPFSRTYLYSEFENGKEVGGKIDLIRLFGIIAILILVIACINFMNLSTARSEKRAKEVGIRKTVGAQKRMLVTQFLSESLLISLISAVLALCLIWISRPWFNTLVERQLTLNVGDFRFWVSGIVIILFTGLLAGSYPALYLSSFRPTSVLKGTFQKVNTLITPRKVLVVLQFTFAITLITATIIVKQQIKSVQNRQLGYSKNNLVYTLIEGDIDKNYAMIKENLLASGTALSVTKSSAPITEGWSNSWGFEWKGKSADDKTIIQRVVADDAVVKTMGLELIEGRDFELSKYPTDSTAVILNEAAVKHMKLTNPIGQVIKDNGIDWHVVGVVRDFILQSPFQPVEPMVIEGAAAWFNVIHIKLNPANSISQNLSSTESVFKTYNPEYPFNVNFVDKQYEQKFNNEKRIEKLAGLFTAFTILISCLGLFGLASYMAENRKKEIGVRKVLGATIGNLTSLLSKEFLKLVVVAFVIATPLSYYIMNIWLQDFAYRITISWWIFLLAGILAIALAIATVSYQAIKAAVANPVKNLRTE